MTAAGAPDPRTMARLAEILAFDTVSRSSNLACIDWARAHCEAHGAVTRLDFNEDRTKANMLATFGEGPGGIVLSGHVDVVPVDGQPWTVDPFALTVKDGRAYGRGACDMKGFDAVVMGHVPDYAAAARAAGRPIHVAFTYDEERGCLGIPKLIEAMHGWGIRPDGAVIGEPTMMRLVSSHKGGRIWRCRVTGKAAHSSLTHQAVNAIEYAAAIIARIQQISDRERTQGLRVEGFDVPFTTISTNLFSGGNGSNIVPALAEFLFDYRFVPGFDPETIMADLKGLAAELEGRMKAVAPETGIAFELVNKVPALDAKPTDEIYAMSLALLPDKTVEKVAYGTEASFFQDYGVPSIVCGPGSIEQAHKADEFVALDQLAACDRFIGDLLGTMGRRKV
ncbi:acetylornithine deacetylase [uncultured Alsobacter sp.]|uniref:acetylornithine deacetylase n=1 Tax=uncultured Alsobacter sp. TaxID=1748258 RepID=UPI0025E672A5|nr:acetylornithine deacetylase [uncultured Alsobacter sp.]